MAEMSDKARDEFHSEAQEIIEGLSRDLLALDAGKGRGGGPDPELVNNVFRAVHTLKGLAGLFGAGRMSTLSHELENVLDHLRLGKLDLTQQVLDLLFRAVELYGRILAVEKGSRIDPLHEVDELMGNLGRLSATGIGLTATPTGQYELDPALLAVLTEYEEHRLRTNIDQGLSLFRLRVTFALSTIDEALNNLKALAKPHGEIITYLPTGEGSDADSIQLDILMASRQPLSVLDSVLGNERTEILEVPKRYSDAPSHQSAADPYLTEAPDHAPLSEPVPSVAVPQNRSLPVRAQVPGMVNAPGAPGAQAQGGITLRSVTQTVRVDIRKLDLLMNIVGELAIVRNAIGRLSDQVRKTTDLREVGMELYRLHRGFERHLAEMQHGILEVRMVPLGQLFDKIARIVRQISREVGKEVNLVITGAETEVDKLIVEELSDPLMHMIRNAIDHGIEAAEVRERVGKLAAGTLALNAFQKGSHVVIEIEDDGAGIDEKKLLRAALRRGVLEQEQSRDLGRRELLNLIFVPGISTKTDVGELSGRGVGMDVVKTNIAKLGGIIDIHSQPGIGSKFTVTLPITLAIISALIVRVAGRTFAIPLSSVQEAIWLDLGALRRLEGRELMTLRGTTLPLCRLRDHFGLEGEGEHPAGPRPYAVVVAVGTQRLGLVVDNLIGQQDIVIKPLGASLQYVRGFAGATELGDQRVALVIDAPALIEEVFLPTADILPGALGHG